MGKPSGFVEFSRRIAERRPVDERLRDWKEVYLPIADETLRRQGARCMDCAIPFCHQGCPLGNLIPDWNDLVYLDKWAEGIVRLHATNNFPEFTGRLCPAPCEGSCVLAINSEPVTIKQIENALIDRAFEEGWVVAQPPATRTDKRVAVVGSGPAGLAAAQQLNRAGHSVTVFERDDRPGGLLRYGIPEFKMEKRLLDRRLQLMEEEGVVFETGCDVGVTISTHKLREEFDAMILAGRARQPRDLPIPGRELNGIHFAMTYLTLQNRLCEGDAVSLDPFLNAEGKNVVIIGGGDTGPIVWVRPIVKGQPRSHSSSCCPARPTSEIPHRIPGPSILTSFASLQRTKRVASGSTPSARSNSSGRRAPSENSRRCAGR